ncbi:MAG: bifunctional UDP-N-acetylglucosamine diphosphorylase/glucosamine-1-phosphate N-acetyltransferase GlmU [Zoogloeaceae bacterium]|jgi:bifunctional UDP-N-acetylglucosamine pyrophosphorylase/glucosamine-1-phosphate N-acetyltransferase|nr:bifunctional UDP-N-acetylglucosamine diphosphorylase/glucosamine-1-phosphate N-acetyltransferase GlmU [Zoogloeaceae bacterium]
MNPCNIVILAAGQGKRMHSALPKVLHPIAGKPMLLHVVETARQLSPARLVVVYGHGGEMVRQAIAGEDIYWVLQERQLGTGHAVREALPCLDERLPVLVLYGDVPLIRRETLERLAREACQEPPGMGLLTAEVANPRGYGRIVRVGAGQGEGRGEIRAIVEEKDATEADRGIREINTGIMLIPAGYAQTWLAELKNDNAQGEYYLTDLVAAACRAGIPVRAVEAEHFQETEGANDKAQLAALERHFQLREANALLDAGVHLFDPARLDVRGRLVCGRNVSIDVGCVFEGEVILEDDVSIGPYCVIRNARIGAGARVAAFTHMDEANVGAESVVGPYARLRPGAELGSRAHVGNFVEIKNTRLGEGSKANHLSYLGDAEIGAEVNVGAGVITCNYDGANKHKTIIQDRAFIGSDCQLVAPVTVGEGATVGAGTTLRRNAPAGSLTVMKELSQTSVRGWGKPEKVGKE